MKKEEPASPPRSSRRAPVLAPFTINPRPAGERDRQYLAVDVCRRYWETRTPVPWSDIHLPNGWHLADRVPIPPVLASGRARRPSAAAASSRTTCSTTTAEEEARLLKRVMDDSMYTHDERQWDGLEEAMALSAARDIAFPELQMVAVEERREGAGRVPAAAGQGVGLVLHCSGDGRRHGRELVPHSAAVTGAGGVATGGGGAGTSSRPARPRPPRTSGPPVDAAGLRRPRQRRRRHRRSS
ncbi:hypothetical protein CFC21_084463, partial [Triticum aestivum]